jgi:cell division transport system permease protein
LNYTLHTALASLWHERWINLLCTFTIGLGLFLIAIASVGVYNLKLVTRQLPDRFTMVVFLSDSITEDTAKEIQQTVSNHKEVSKVRYISPDEAMSELRASLKDADYIFKGIEGNPLPASLEVNVRRSAVTGGIIGRLAKELSAIEGISDIQYASGVVKLIQRSRKYADAAGFGLIAVLCVTALFVCYSTIRILFYRKKDEIETLKLLGATKFFIRAPFLIEGMVLGLIGGTLGLGGIMGVYSGIHLKLALTFPALKSIVFPLQYMGAMPVMGMLIGITGAAFAIGRIRF